MMVALVTCVQCWTKRLPGDLRGSRSGPAAAAVPVVAQGLVRPRASHWVIVTVLSAQGVCPPSGVHGWTERLLPLR